MEKNQNECPLVSINSRMVPMSREEREEKGIYIEYNQYNIWKSRRVLYNKTKTNSFYHIVKKTSSNKTQKFWFSATKYEAPLLNVCLPADLLTLFFPLSTPLTQIPLHTGWMVQWADLVLSLEKLQKPFPSPSVIQIHPNLFWVDLVLRRAVFATEYHKLKVQNLFTPKEKASPVRKHLHAETHQVMGPHTVLRRWSLPPRCWKLSLVTSSQH